LLLAWIASVVAGWLFHRAVERPAGRWLASRRGVTATAGA
jgi:peptidoglycan/LPS O-acetylase OafA/YrhL